MTISSPPRSPQRGCCGSPTDRTKSIAIRSAISSCCAIGTPIRRKPAAPPPRSLLQKPRLGRPGGHGRGRQSGEIETTAHASPRSARRVNRSPSIDQYFLVLFESLLKRGAPHGRSNDATKRFSRALGGPHMRVSLGIAMIFLASSIAAAEPPLSIERLLSEGWEIAGYASGYDNRTSLILFRHA